MVEGHAVSFATATDNCHTYSTDPAVATAIWHGDPAQVTWVRQKWSGLQAKVLQAQKKK